jgi:hypothetical protein
MHFKRSRSYVGRRITTRRSRSGAIIGREEGNKMKRFHVFKDGKMQASTATKAAAIDLIRVYQEKETHPILRANFSIIEGEEEFIPYKNNRRLARPTIAGVMQPRPVRR